MVTLDLTEVLAVASLVEEVAALVRQLFPIMTAWRMHRYALAAWLMLREALELRQVRDLIPRLPAVPPSALEQAGRVRCRVGRPILWRVLE
jgi:hypothetical protein